MKISDVVELLNKLKAKHGDLEVKTQTLTHRWEPDISVRGEGKGKYILLNS